MRKFSQLVFFILISVQVIAQQPVISNISKQVGFTGNNIEISGSGFSTVPANLVVRFGAMEGQVLSATDNFILASIPIGTTSSSISVTNLASNLTGYSSTPFYLTFPGEIGGTLATSTRTSFPNTHEFLDIAMVDLDEDGKNDIVATKIDALGTDLVIYKNTSAINAISFTEQSEFIGNPTANVGSGDIDGDGKPDIVVSRAGSSNRNQIYVLRNTSTTGTISFAAAKSYFLPTGHIAKQVIIRDIDMDGKPEVSVSNTFSNEISIFENNSTPGNINLNFTPVGLTIPSASTTNGLAVEDLNDDGKPDFIITQFFSTDIFIIPNESVDGNMLFGAEQTISVNGSLNNVDVTDLDLDGKPDIVATVSTLPEIAVLRNTSTTGISFSTPQTLPTGSNCWGVIFGDYIGNGKNDVIITSSSGSIFTLFSNTSVPGTITLTRNDVSQTVKTRNGALGDLNGDSKPDLALTGFTSGGSFELLTIRNTTCIEPILPPEDLSVEICNGQPPHRFNVAPAEGTTFIWKKSGVDVKNSTDPFYDTDIAGTYTVTAVSESGSCSIESGTFTLTTTTGTIPTNPTASNDSPKCIGDDIQLNSTTVSGATYEWSGPNGFTSTVQNPLLSSATPAMAGIYSLVAKITPCESVVSTTLVEVLTPPDFTIVASGPVDFCQGSSVTLSVALETGYTYQWQKDGVDVSGATSNSYIATTAGMYQVLVTSVSCNLSSNQVTVGTFPPPTVSFTIGSTVCVLSDVSFTNTTVPETGQTPVFTWDFGDGSATSSTENPTHNYTTANTYTVALTVDYAGQSCAGNSSQSLTIVNPDVLTISPSETLPFCEGDTITLEAMGSFSAYLWNTGDTTSIVQVSAGGTYTVDASSSSGCMTSDSLVVTTNPAPTITATAIRETIELGQSTQLEATGGVSYSWTPPENLDDPTSDMPIASPLLTTTYTVIGTDSSGCDGMADILITVQDAGNKLPINAPRSFSPNGDTIDDLWVIESIENFPDCEIVIFNRSGKILYTKTGYTNDWDGRDQNGNDLPEGAYYYTISCTDTKTASGSISIIR